LSPQGRHYFQLLYVESRPVKAVAEETGTSMDALYAWRSRLGKLLRQLHGELVSEGEKHV
jgi:RNA polymerase sigma-70 factor (ECF subfamily)